MAIAPKKPSRTLEMNVCQRIVLFNGGLGHVR